MCGAMPEERLPNPARTVASLGPLPEDTDETRQLPFLGAIPAGWVWVIRLGSGGAAGWGGLRGLGGGGRTCGSREGQRLGAIGSLQRHCGPAEDTGALGCGRGATHSPLPSVLQGAPASHPALALLCLWGQ